MTPGQPRKWESRALTAAGATPPTCHRLLKYGFGVSLLGAVPLTLYPLHDTFAPWLALCSPQYSAAAKAAEAQGHAAVQLSQLQDSMLTTGIMGGWAGVGCRRNAARCEPEGAGGPHGVPRWAERIVKL